MILGQERTLCAADSQSTQIQKPCDHTAYRAGEIICPIPTAQIYDRPNQFTVQIGVISMWR